MDEARLRRAFLEEAEEMVGDLNRRLVELEQETSNRELVNEVFRLYHSLKSESALMGLAKLSEMAHRTEDVFDLVKEGSVALDRTVMDAVFAATDLINEMIARVSAGGGDAEFSVDNVLEQLDRCCGKTVARSVALGQVPEPVRREIRAEQQAEFSRADRPLLEEGRARRERLYRVTCELDEASPMKFPRAYLIVSNLESVASVLRSVPSLEIPADGGEVNDEAFGRFAVYLTSSEGERAIAEAVDVDEVRKYELVELDYEDILGPAAEEAPAARPEPQQPAPRSRPAPERTSIRVETKKLDDIWSLVGQLVITKGRLERLRERAPAGEGSVELREELEAVGDTVGGIAEGLQQAMMETRMVPISVLFDKFPRLVRDLSKQIGKEADLQIRGETTEVDRSFVEALSDPLTHIIRNCLDHGLEPPERRLRSGKPERGTISVSAYQEGGKVVVEIADDGRGLDLQRIRAKAVEKGLLAPDEQRADAEIIEYIFRPGFSTAEAVTDISGRGVGMDVVATRIREVLKGEVMIRTEAGAGTRFSIVLPLTLTILNTLVVGLAGQHYAIPVRNIDETVKLADRDITSSEAGRTAPHRGEEIPVYFLAELLGGSGSPRDTYDAVIVTHREKRAYLAVDELVEELDVVIKPVDDVVNPGRLYSGVSVLGDGRILLVLSTTFIGD